MQMIGILWVWYRSLVLWEFQICVGTETGEGVGVRSLGDVFLLSGL